MDARSCVCAARVRPRARGDARSARENVADVASTFIMMTTPMASMSTTCARAPRTARARRSHVVASSSSSATDRAVRAPTVSNRVVGDVSLRRGADADALAPPRRFENTVAVVRHPTTETTEFMTPSFAMYALCGVGCLLGSALSAVLLSLIPTLRSVRRAMDEVAYLAASVREEVPDTLAAVRVSGLELTDVMEEVGELTADVGGGLRSAGRGVTASVAAAQTVGRYAAAAIPEVRRRAQPLVGSVRDQTVRVLEERADMEPYSGPIISNTAKTAKKGVTAARNALKSADVARNVGRLYKTIRAPPKKPK